MNRANLWRASLLMVVALAAACGQELANEQADSRLASREDEVFSTNQVLILESTVTGGTDSPEAAAVRKFGYQVKVVNNTEWAAMTADQFATYRAIVLGDASCASLDAVSAAVANRGVWGPVVNGNILIAGTAPVQNGAALVTEKAIRFAAYAAGKTGLYVSLSCYYQDAAPSTHVALLEPFGDFSVQGGGCHASAHIVAQHPVLDTLSDEAMSNWPCSVNSAFDSFPIANFAPWSIAMYAEPEISGSSMGTQEFVDGTFGAPYILARGATLLGCGDGELQLDEECDYGLEVNGMLGVECSSTCRLNWCGDGTVNEGESCDLGPSNGQGECPRSCRFGTPPAPPAHLPPVAVCKHLTLNTPANACGASGSVNNGSYDPDGDLVDCTQSAVSFNLGNQSVTLTCVDQQGLSASCSASVTVVDATAPEITCPAASTFECGVAAPDPEQHPATATDNCGTPVVTYALDGETFSLGSSRSVRWVASDGSNEAACSTELTMVDTQAPVLALNGAAAMTVAMGGTFVDPGASASDACSGNLTGAIVKSGTVNTAAAGTYTLTYSVHDAMGLGASVVRSVTVEQAPQSCTSVAVKSPREIWPPNHKMWSFNLSECAVVQNPCGAPVDINAAGTITSIYSDEVEDANGNGDGSTLQDIVVTGKSSFQLRAERQGKGNGRVYGVNFKVTDTSGAVQTATCKFVVPHDQSGRIATDDGAAAGYTVSSPY